MDTKTLQAVEECYQIWKDFFLVNTSNESVLKAPVGDLKLLVEYIDYLKNEPLCESKWAWSWESFLLGLAPSLLVVGTYMWYFIIAH